MFLNDPKVAWRKTTRKGATYYLAKGRFPAFRGTEGLSTLDDLTTDKLGEFLGQLEQLWASREYRVAMIAGGGRDIPSVHGRQATPAAGRLTTHSRGERHRRAERWCANDGRRAARPRPNVITVMMIAMAGLGDDLRSAVAW